MCLSIFELLKAKLNFGKIQLRLGRKVEVNWLNMHSLDSESFKRIVIADEISTAEENGYMYIL